MSRGRGSRRDMQQDRDSSALGVDPAKRTAPVLQRERLGLLSGVAGERFTSGINTQLLCATRAKLVFWQHSKHCFAHELFWTALQQRPNRNFLQPARISTVVAINLLVDLIPCQSDALGIDHNDVIATIEVRREARFILADQKPRDASRQPSEDLAVRVDYKPILTDRECLGLSALWNIRPHLLSHTFPVKDKRQV
jgi:hypothetical protein